MEWVRRLIRRDEQRPKGLSPKELADALTLWRENNSYAWWLNDNLDTVSAAVQRQMGLVRETRVAVAVQRKQDLPEADKSRLVEGFDRLLAILDAVTMDPPAGQDLWPGHSFEQFRHAIDDLMEGTHQARSDLISGEMSSAHEGFKVTVEDWLFASVPARYRLNAYMRESLPPEVLASLPSSMLPTEPPKELARYARGGGI